MRKALVVGCSYYANIKGLFGCVDDAYSVKSALERNSNGTINFDVHLLSATGPTDQVTRAELKSKISDLFSGNSDIALFYFAGHGYSTKTGTYLCTSDTRLGDDGVALSDILTLANDSKAKNKVIILDSCHSGSAGGTPSEPEKADLSEGLTILTASTAEQYAVEENGKGVFTTLLVDALNGAAGNLVGAVTPGSVYAHIDQSLGPWEQRPVFKTNVKSFVSLREVQAPIAIGDLRRITEFFPEPGFSFKLNPSFEPERAKIEDGIEAPDPENTRIFGILQKYNRVNLVVPVDAPHMYHAAMENKSCRLTVLGEHYRQLVARNRI